MKHVRVVWVIGVLVAAILAAASQRSHAQATDARHVVVISIDGLKPSTYTADGPSKVPTLRRLAREGAYAEGVIGVTPTVTYPSHTTMISGVLPAVHGIYNNQILDPEEISNGSWYSDKADAPLELATPSAAPPRPAEVEPSVAVFRAPLEGPPSGRAMPQGCRAIHTTPPRRMTEGEMEGQRDPYKAERASAAAAGANALLVLSKVIMPRRDFDCPAALRITDCPGATGAWLQVVFESYACTADALKTLSTPPPKK